MGLEDLKRDLAYLEQSDANKAAADEIRKQIAELEPAKPKKPAK